MMSAMTEKGRARKSKRAAETADVHDPLREPVPAADRRLREAHDGHAVQILDPGANRSVGEVVPSDFGVERLTMSEGHEVPDPLVSLERQRDVERVDGHAVHYVADLTEPADDGNSAVPRELSAKAVVEETHHAKPELLVVDELVGDGSPELSGAGDEDVPEAEPAPPSRFSLAPDGGPRESEKTDVENHEHAQHELRVLVLAGVGPVQEVDAGVESDEEHRRRSHRHRPDDGEELVGPRAEPLQAVQPVEIKEGGPEEKNQRQEPQVLTEGIHSLGDGEEIALEADEVRERERREGGEEIGGDVEPDPDTALLLDHYLVRSAPLRGARSARSSRGEDRGPPGPVAALEASVYLAGPSRPARCAR